jgi:uncharacterized protein (TIGR02147 family)
MQNSTQDLILQSESVADFLKKEYLRRLDRNPNYSLRAFARDLELSPSRLSESLNLNKGLSVKTIQKISTQLKLKKKAQELLRDLCLAHSHKNKGVRNQAIERVQNSKKENEYRRIDDEKFKVISDWYHSAILEMTHLKNFKNETNWIARKLGIAPLQAQAAIDRLTQLGLLKNEDGRLIATPEIMRTSSPVPSSAIRKFHRQMIEKSYRSLQEDEMNQRDLNSMILALPKERLPEFREQIQIFMKQFWEWNANLEKDQLYALNIQLIPIIKDQESKI